MSATAIVVIFLTCGACAGCSSPPAPSATVDLTGTWVGFASDAGPVRWTIIQTAGTVTGTSTLIDASTGSTVVTGVIKGTQATSGVNQTLAFEQVIEFFQFPAMGQWSQYWSMSFDTTGTLTISGQPTHRALSRLCEQPTITARPAGKRWPIHERHTDPDQAVTMRPFQRSPLPKS